MKRRAHWLIPGGARLLEEQVRGSGVASVRMRCGASLSALAEDGWEVSLGECMDTDPELVLVGKIGAHDLARRCGTWLAQVRAAKSRGAAIVADYSDHHLGLQTPLTGFYRDLIPLADAATVPSDAMAGLLQSVWSGLCVTIPEPVELPWHPARIRSIGAGRPVQLLWFGHDSNVGYLNSLCLSTPRMRQPGIELLIVSSAASLESFRREVIDRGVRVRARFMSWSLQHLVEASLQSDGCLIPSDPSDARKRGAGANRLTTALALGLPTAASSLPSYEPLRQFHVDIDSPEFDSFLDDPGRFAGRVAQAQESALHAYEMAQVGRKWAAMAASVRRCTPGRVAIAA